MIDKCFIDILQVTKTNSFTTNLSKCTSCQVPNAKMIIRVFNYLCLIVECSKELNRKISYRYVIGLQIHILLISIYTCISLHCMEVKNKYIHTYFNTSFFCLEKWNLDLMKCNFTEFHSLLNYARN